jgi:dolichol-phosphate mannosyltransferase
MKDNTQALLENGVLIDASEFENTGTKPKISLVIPVYNEAESLPVLAEHLKEVMKSDRYDFEAIFVNDGSQDNTFAILLKLQAKDARFKVIDLGRNFGQQPAFSAGIDYAEGDAVILLDADLQDPPELVFEFLKKWEEGYDVVYAVRQKRKEGLFKKFCFTTFYKILNSVSSTPMPMNAGCFGLMNRQVVDIIKSMREHNRYIPGIRTWVGFRQFGIAYERPARYAGSAIGFRSLAKLGLDGIISFSTAPLTLIYFAGLIISGSSFLLSLFYAYRRLIDHTGPYGFATIICVLLFLGGMILLSLGIIGQYIARIYDEVRSRPLYTIKRTYGCSSNGKANAGQFFKKGNCFEEVRQTSGMVQR